MKQKTPATIKAAGADIEVFGQRPVSSPISSNFQSLRGWRVDASLSVELLWRPTLREVYQ